MLHILFIANCLGLYGANRSMIELADGLHELGQEVFFFFPYEEMSESRHRMKKELEKHGFVHAFLSYSASVYCESNKGIRDRVLRGKRNLKCLPVMESYVDKWKIDIVHTNSFTHTIGALLSERKDIPHVWHIREALQKDYGLDYDSRLLYWYALRKTKQVICISEYVRDVHNKELRASNVAVLYDGFDVERYILNGAYNADTEVFNILISGVIWREKGQLDAVRAVELLIRKYKVRNVRLQIVGDGTGAYCDRIRRFIKKKGIGKYVEMLPFQEDLRELRKRADIALMCSTNEALGRVTIESMLSENLVIGADSAGTAEIIKGRQIGYLYQPGNINELCEKLYYVMTYWKEQGGMIRRAKEYARKKYDVKTYAKNILHIYKTLI